MVHSLASICCKFLNDIPKICEKCHLPNMSCTTRKLCLQCFDAVGWAAGRASGLLKTEWWGTGMVICLERGADLHMAQLMPLPLTVSCSSKIQIDLSRLILPFWYRLTQVVLEKRPLNGCNGCSCVVVVILYMACMPGYVSVYTSVADNSV